DLSAQERRGRLEFAQSGRSESHAVGASERADPERQSAVSAEPPAGHRAVEAAGTAADAARGAGIPSLEPPPAAARSRRESGRRCTSRNGANEDRMTLCA